MLDLLFVGVLKLGVGSAALATIISQFISALLCLRRLLRSPEEYRLVPSRIRFDPIMLKQIISNGLPAGLQNSIIALANVVVQSNINSFGKWQWLVVVPIPRSRASAFYRSLVFSGTDHFYQPEPRSQAI